MTVRTLLAGPRRLVLIQSGKFDFADIDLSRPLQLVGDNAIGKTALISTLQFLYLDDQRSMRFGKHNLDQTRRFYFHSEESFILFECETSLGTVILGARGLGPANGYELQRFAWRGTFLRDDFITAEGRAKGWDEVRPALALRGLQIIQDAAELRGLLGAVDVETETSWGLVPLADAKDYPRFRLTFQRLLDLRNLRQDDLKLLLADSARLTASEREVDLARDFDKDLSVIDRDRVEIGALREAAPLVEEVLRLHGEELSARGLAHCFSRELQRRFAEHADNFKQALNAIYGVRDEAFKEHARLEKKRIELDEQRGKARERIGALKERLTKLTQAKPAFAGFVAEVETQVLRNLVDEVMALKVRLKDLPDESPATLAQQLAEKQKLLAEREASARKVGDLFITWLRVRLPAQSVARLGALFDRSLLEAVMDERVTIIKEADLLKRLNLLAEQCDARGYEDETIHLEFGSGSLSAAGRIGQLETLQAEARDLKRQVERVSQQIETLRDAAAWRAKLATAERDHAAQVQRLASYKSFQEELVHECDLTVELANFQKQDGALAGQLVENESARAKEQEVGNGAIKRAEALREEDRLVRTEAKDMPVAEGDDPGGADPAASDLPKSLLEAFRIARERCNKARSLSQQLCDKTARLDQQFLTPSFHYDHTAPLADRLAQLKAEIASIEERVTDVENRWRSVLMSARSSFATILRSLKELHKKRRVLNEELARIEFSSLREVRLELVEDASAVAEYRRHAEDATQPSIFDTPDEADRKLSQFHALLKRRPRLVLNDLFALRCEVQRKDGVRNFYDDFDQVESTGTTIVLKVTLNLLVLRDLLIPGKARIPFYLDEVHALDRQNFANILQLSERLGFVGIFASPTPAVGPRSFVHLAPDARDRLVITSAHRKDIVREPGESSSADANASP